MEKYFRLPLH